MEALLAAMDVGRVLAMTNMDLEGLQDPDRAPALKEKLEARPAAEGRSNRSRKRSESGSMADGNTAAA